MLQDDLNKVINRVTIIPQMQDLMEFGNSEKIKELKLIAKWSAEINEKKKAILQLRQFSEEARPAIEEVMAVTAYDDIKQACLHAIRSLADGQKDRAAHNNRMKSLKKKRILKTKKQNKKKRMN